MQFYVSKCNSLEKKELKVDSSDFLSQMHNQYFRQFYGPVSPSFYVYSYLGPLPFPPKDDDNIL